MTLSREQAAREIVQRLGYRIVGNSDEVGRTGWLRGDGKWVESDCTAEEFAFWDALITEHIALHEAQAELDSLTDSLRAALHGPTWGFNRTRPMLVSDAARTHRRCNENYDLWKAAEAEIARLPADWWSDSSLDTWFPMTAEELKRTRQERDEARQERDDSDLAFEHANEVVGKLQADYDEAQAEITRLRGELDAAKGELC